MENRADHFSHPHTLNLVVYDQTLNLKSPCPACKLKPSAGMLYTCTVCKDYFLHKQCFEMPKSIDHLCHKKHGLTLLPKPAYKQDYFVCNACGESGVGFSYNCGRCDVDLHITCALLPLFVKHKSHAHKLDLTFESPYPSRSFTCGICDAPGSRHWLYRCKLCEFNAHLTCARSVDKKEVSLIGFDESQLISPKAAPPDSVASCSGLAPTAPQLPPVQQPNIMTNNVALGVASGAPILQPRFLETNRQMVNNDLALHVVKQWIINNVDAIALAILSGRGSGGGGFGGGYGGNNMGAGLQQVMMQLMSNGGTGGGGIPTFGGYGGGGGGGGQGSSQAVTGSQVSMQAVIGGGGGGIPSLSSFGGGGGGIPGLSGFVGGGGGGIPGLSDFVGGGGGGIPSLSSFGGGGGGIPGLSGFVGGGGGGIPGLSDFVGGGGSGIPGLSGFVDGGGGGGGQDTSEAEMGGVGVGGMVNPIVQTLLGDGNGIGFLGAMLGGLSN